MKMAEPCVTISDQDIATGFLLEIMLENLEEYWLTTINKATRNIM